MDFKSDYGKYVKFIFQHHCESGKKKRNYMGQKKFKNRTSVLKLKQSMNDFSGNLLHLHSYGIC